MRRAGCGSGSSAGRVSFCVIINAKSGACSEDCAFCSQSARAQSGAPHYPLLSKEKLLDAAQAAAAAGAARFSLVTSGRGVVTSREQEAIVEAVAAIREAVPTLRLCGSLGIVDREFLRDLKAAGLFRFHHNLEAAASHFPQDLHHPHLRRAGGHHRGGPGGGPQRVRRGHHGVG